MSIKLTVSVLLEYWWTVKPFLTAGSNCLYSRQMRQPWIFWFQYLHKRFMYVLKLAEFRRICFYIDWNPNQYNLGSLCLISSLPVYMKQGGMWSTLENHAPTRICPNHWPLDLEFCTLPLLWHLPCSSVIHISKTWIFTLIVAASLL